MTYGFEAIKKKLDELAKRFGIRAEPPPMVGIEGEHHTTVKPPEPTAEDAQREKELEAKVKSVVRLISRIVKAVRAFRAMK